MKRREALRKTAVMAGSAGLTPSLVALLQSCQQQTRLDWTPIFLSNEQAVFISTLVDTILPKTGTPGALELNVDIFIDKVFAEMYDEQAQTRVVSEIDNFNADCKQELGKVFAELSPDKRVEVLTGAEANSGKFGGQVWGTAVGTPEPVGFYRSLKSLALWAYFTSEEVGRNILSYDPIPGDYLGCIPLSQVGNTWSL